MNATRPIQPKFDVWWLLWLAVTFLFIMFSLASCKPVTLQHTTSHTDSTIIRERLVPINIPSTSVQKTFTKAQVDSIITALKNLPANSRTIYYTDPKLKTQLSFTLDSIGRLVVQCKTLEAMYWEKLKEKDRIIERKEQIIQEQQKTFGQKLSKFLTNGIWFIVLALVAFNGIIWLINRKKTSA